MMTARTPYRLAEGGRIDRGRKLAFSLDGKPMNGFSGDTLASALLGAGVTLVGRSFKYHRPRGFMSAGVEEPNGLFTLGEGGRSEPNIPATVTELVEGLVARRQNGWPSVDLDVMAVNSLAAPFLSTGFYYKTFMGPARGSWMLYEPFIRRAAGLGKGSYERDPDRYDSSHAFADVLVIGAGPAGLAAALTAGRSGARVVLAEQDSLLGGSLLSESAAGAAEEWRRQRVGELEALPNVEVLLRTTALGLYDGNTVALVERRDHLRPDPAKGEARQVIITLRARTIIFATGAFERPLVFANNDRPGVMLASAVRSYLNRFAVVPGGRAVVVANNDSAYRTGFDLAKAGVAVTLADLRSEVGAALKAKSKALGIEHLTGTAVLDVTGGKSVRGVLLGPASDSGGARQTQERECDVVCVSGGWSPVVHLTSHCGIKPRYVSDIASFVPGGFAPGQFGAGALNGSFGLATAVAEGREAGNRAAVHAGYEKVAADLPLAEMEPEETYAIEPVWQVPQVRRGKAFVDFQNDVTVKDLTIAHQEGYRSVEHLKRYTTLGMGTDQGKTSNINALAIMAGLREVDIPDAGTTTFRPPYSPVAIGALVGRTVGHHFRPIRRSPLHDWHIANGCEMIEAGPWMRAWYYRWAGATPETAYVEEMRMVRKGVGISDVSSLGKIDVQGPDAAEFLNRIYVNGFAKLPIGKARYGIMLSDDGIVLDDGTTTRLSETRYFMTTTTAQAGEVMSWIEFLLQTAWTDLKVHVSSLTDEWAGMVVSGPKARHALELAFPGRDLSDAKLPYMGCLEIEQDSVPVRLIRLSFSGELAYEVYIPADHGVVLWEYILSAAAPLGIKPYGLEALASLRIEKGHVAGLELDHRNTLEDLGLGKMASTQKPYIGDELRQRPLLHAKDRWSLIGIECLEAGKRLRGGSILFAANDKIEGHGRGYITSVTWSTELDKFIALALFQGGLEHEGEEIVCAFPLKDEQVRARIVSPHFIDPKGARLHA
ncbi:MAG: methylglutamate dehydrogenase subunit [Rhodospirillaceae bacterium]|jgi:sarcosine oxidase subunit alpha|nr:methylglutamate dehydrogenase subunit [Rhodospirillaceae bacterium]